MVENMDEKSDDKGTLHENGSGDSEKPYSFSVVPFSIEQHLEFLDIYKDGSMLLGSSSMTVRNWIGSIWFFEHCDVYPTKEESVCGHGCESCVSCGQFLDSREKVIIGDDTGMLSVLSLDRFDDDSVHFVSYSSQVHHEGNIVSLSLTRNRKQTISSGTDLRINVWDNNNLEVQTMYDSAHSRSITCVRTLTEEGSPKFCSSSLDGLVLLWDPRQSKPATAIYSSTCGLTALAWRNETEIYVGSVSGEIVHSDIRYKNDIHKYKFAKYPVHKICSRDNLIAACGESNNVLVWDSLSHDLRYADSRHTGLVRDIAWNPVNEKFYSCGFDSRIYSHEVPSDF